MSLFSALGENLLLVRLVARDNLVDIILLLMRFFQMKHLIISALSQQNFSKHFSFSIQFHRSLIVTRKIEFKESSSKFWTECLKLCSYHDICFFLGQ